MDHLGVGKDEFDARVLARPGIDVRFRQRNVYRVKCFDKHGDLKWEDEILNAIVDEGLDEALNTSLRNTAPTASWFLGLTTGSPTIAAGDTMGSHAGWTEYQNYSEANRQGLTWTAPANPAGTGRKIDNVGNLATYTINGGGGTVGGGFIASSNTKGGTTGKLFAAGAFSGGNRTVADADTVQVTVTVTYDGGI